MTITDICVIQKDGKLFCSETSSSAVAVFVGALNDNVKTLSDLIYSVNSKSYPWNMDYYSHEGKLVRDRALIGRFHPKIDIPLASFKSWMDFRRIIEMEEAPEGSTVIDLNTKSVIHLDNYSPNSAVFPRRLTVVKLNDPQVEKEIKECKKEEERLKQAGKDVNLECWKKEHAIKDIPRGFEPIDIDLGGCGKPPYAQLFDMLTTCNPSGNFYESLGKCLRSRLK